MGSGNIAKLMKAMRVVPSTSNDEIALKAFDGLVHSVLPDVFIPALGRLTFSLKHMILLSLLVYGADAADELAALPKDGLGNLALALDRVWRSCFQLPLVMAVVE